MDRISTTNKALNLFGAGKHGFKDGNLALGIAPTEFSAAWCNGIQEELLSVIEAAAIAPSAGSNVQLLAAINQLLTNASAPAGAVVFYAQSTAPTGWLKANGALISRTTYAALFSAIGTTYGAGDGATTFKLPDLRGEFLRGWDDGRGVDAGRANASAQSDAMQGHKHTFGWVMVTSYDGGQFGRNFLVSGSNDTGGPITDGTNGTPRTAAETRPRNIAMLPCIKY